jgi:hypothetical protein
MQQILPHEIHGQKILFTALNWGYGHVMRSLVLLKKLQNQGNMLHIVGNAEQIQLYKSEGLNANFIEKAGYPFDFSGKGNFAWDFIKNYKALKKHYNREQKRVELLCEKSQIDIVISDQSMGFFSRKVPSILITHQIQLPLKWWQKSAQKIYNKQIDNFHHIWIPDIAPPNNLAGKLSETSRKNASYIGFLSRFEKLNAVEQKYDVGVLVTGPQPYAEQFFQEMCQRFDNSPEKVFIIYNGTDLKTHKNIDIFQHQATHILAELLCGAHLIISRSGYSTLMDFKALGLTNVELHATPGQGEQEYLKNQWSELETVNSLLNNPCMM